MVKVINNAVAAANTAVAAEALLAGKPPGADLDALVTVIRAGSGASAMLELKAGRCAHTTTHALQARAHAEGPAPLPRGGGGGGRRGWSWSRTTEESSPRRTQRGLGEQDFAALLEVVEERAGARLEPLG